MKSRKLRHNVFYIFHIEKAVLWTVLWIYRILNPKGRRFSRGAYFSYSPESLS
jgi:hypothetical protein